MASRQPESEVAGKFKRVLGDYLSRPSAVGVKLRTIPEEAAGFFANMDAHGTVQGQFAIEISGRLPESALDQLREIIGITARRRPAAIRAWTRRWQVDTWGVRSWALRQLESCQEHGPRSSIVLVYHCFDACGMLEPHPELDTRKAYLERVATLVGHLWDLASDSDRSLRQISPRSDDHVEWLARYQVGHESFNAIALRAGRTRQSVTEAIKAIAGILDLRLRPPNSGGRPTK